MEHLWPILILPLAWLLVRWVESDRRARAFRRLVDLDDRLDRIDLLGFLGRHEEMAPLLGPAASAAGTLSGCDGALPRARCHILSADHDAAAGQVGAARAHLEQALDEIIGARNARLAEELRTRAEASLGLLATPQDQDETLFTRGEQALAREARVHHRDTLVRLAELAHWLGQAHQQRGRWDKARPFYESAVRIGERLPRPRLGPREPIAAISWVYWSRARASASAAAVDLGTVLCSLGERDAGLGWLDRGVAALQDGETALARFAFSKALLARATHEPVDALTGMATREDLLRRAVDAGIASDWPSGRCAACEAEVALGLLHLSMGDADASERHLRRAHEHVQELDDSAAGPFILHPLLILGRVLEERGDTDAAREHYRRVLQRGRKELHPEARRYAAVSAYHLHRLLVDRTRLREARTVLEALEGLVPTCAAEARTILSGLAARARALQLLHERHPEEAGRLLERAEELGRLAESPEGTDFAREIAADRGRMALARQKPEEAVTHFRRALDAPAGQQGVASEQAERAGLSLQLAQAMMALDREDEAVRELRRAFEEGRASGQPHGREVAAIAAMLRAHHFEEAVDERRRLLEAARNLGRLSGRPRGREIAEAVEARLRELAE